MLRRHDETTWTLADLRKQLRHEVESTKSPFQFQVLYSWCLVLWCPGKRERKEWLYVLR